MSTNSVAHILEAIRLLDKNHHEWVLEQIRKGEEEAQDDDNQGEDDHE